jgi:single-stranded DNA-binding protein
LVAIDGKLTRRNYVSKEGKNASITEIVIESINSIGSKKDNQSAIINKDNNVLQTKPIELESTKASTIGEVD